MWDKHGETLARDHREGFPFWQIELGLLRTAAGAANAEQTLADMMMICDWRKQKEDQLAVLTYKFHQEQDRLSHTLERLLEHLQQGRLLRGPPPRDTGTRSLQRIADDLDLLGDS